VDLILDAGPTAVGIESTVLSLAGPQPVLLRPGMISIAQIEQIIGPVAPAPTIEDAAHPSPHPSPGLHPRHSRPVTPLLLTGSSDLPQKGRGAFLWLTKPAPAGELIEMPRQAAPYAAILYRTLHHLDRQGFDWIAVEEPPDTPEWAAVRDRLKRASSGFT
jgi:L-threonylcarbamoyladenylate synthase